MGKLGVVLAIITVSSVAVIVLAALWARLGASGDRSLLVGAGVLPDELGLRREGRLPRQPEQERTAVVTLLRPGFDLVSGS